MTRGIAVRCFAVVVGCLCLLCGVGCNSGQGAAPAGWVLAYRNDFSGDKLPAEWVLIDGEATVESGVLVLEGTDNAQIALEEPNFPGSVRMEFDATLTGSDISDMSPFLNADVMGYSAGYLLQFGGGGNTENRLRRAGSIVELTINESILVKPGQKYHVVAENDGGQVRLLVDGKEALTYKDATPLKGLGHNAVGFYTYGCTLKVDKVVVYRRKGEAAGK